VEVSEFRRLIRMGLGRIPLYLQNHESTPYRDVILESCLEITSYDPQVEGNKTSYLLEILDLTGEIDFYREQILTTFASLPPESSWRMDQFFAFAVRFAKRGDERARQLVYDKHKECQIAGRGGNTFDLVDLDGIKGLLYVMETFDNELTSTNLAQDYESILGILEREQGEKETRRILIQTAKDKIRIEAFLESVDIERKRQTVNRESRQKETTEFGELSYEALRERIIESAEKTHLRGWWRWGEKASLSELTKAAESVLQEENPKLLLLYLSIFRNRQFPLDLTRLMYLAEHGDNRVERDRMAIFAISALENITHQNVRDFALKMIVDNNRVGRAVGMLQRNFEPEDWKLLETLTVKELEAEEYHSLGMSVEDIYKRHPSIDAVPTFLNLYEHGPCSECRWRFARTLFLLDALPDEILAECKHDSHNHLREQANNGFMNLEY
jgi:hypothetical protein